MSVISTKIILETKLQFWSFLIPSVFDWLATYQETTKDLQIYVSIISTELFYYLNFNFEVS